jgi:hypothetical protein
VFALSSQLSNYALNSNTGAFVTTGQTGNFYPGNNPSGYITGTVSISGSGSTIVQRDVSGNIYGNSYISTGNQLVLSDGIGSNDSGNGGNTLSLNFSNGVYIGPSGANPIYAIGVPVMYYLKTNQTAIGSTIANYFGVSDTLVPSGVYEFLYELFYTKTTAGTVTYTFTGSSQLNSFAGHFIQTPAPGFGTTYSGTQSSAVIVTGLNSGAAFPATLSLTTAVNHAATIRCLVQNSGNINTVYLAATESAGTITPLLGSYKKITRIA